MSEIQHVTETISEPADTGSNEGLYDAEAIAEAIYGDELADDKQDEASVGDAAPDQSEAVEDGDVQDAETPGDDIPMPESWDAEIWGAMTSEARGKVDSMVKAHAEALAEHERASAQMQAEREHFQARANAEMQTALNLMRQVVEGEFRNVDWRSLAESDPASYVKLQQMYNDRMASIQGMQAQINQHAQAIEQRRKDEAAQQLKSETAAVMPEIKALMGADFNNQKYVADVAEYLQKQGVPAEAIHNISRGYELKLATKAMLYDRILAARETAKQKVAEAPKVAAPSASGADNGDRLKSLKANLAKNPNSTEALAALFANM